MGKHLALILIFFLTVSLTAQKKLSLEESIQIALQSNTNLLKSKNNLEISKSNLKSAYGDLLPTLGVSGSWAWSRISDDGGIQTDFFGKPQQIPESQTDSRSWSVGAGGSVVLFNGLANYANIAKSSGDLKAAELNLEKQKQNIVYQTTDYYYNVLNSYSLMKVREDNLKYNQKLLETIQERNKLGLIPIADLYAQQVQYGNAELQFIQAQNLYEQAKTNLLYYLSLDVLEDYEFIDAYEGLDQTGTENYLKDFGEISSMVAEALDMRLDYKSNLLSLESAASSITIARSGLIPRLTGDYSFGTGAVKYDDLFNRRTYKVGLTLSFPIFSNWNTENQIEYALIQKKNINEDLLALKRQIKIEVKQGYLDLLAGKKSFDVSQKNVIAAEESRRINYERYSLGSGTILDVLQSDKDYTQAVSSKIDAKYEFLRLRDNLLNVLGKLDYKKYE